MRRHPRRDADGEGAPGAPARVRATGLALVVLAALLGRPSAADAQDHEGTPRIPSGVQLAVAPVQSVEPMASGAWPGGGESRREALATLNSEVDFALSEEPLARRWTPPGEVVEQARRNPLLKVDPERLAYRGLLAERDEPDLYAPLHGQVRKLSALLDARLVAVPLRVWYARGDTTAADEDVPRATAGDRRVTVAGRAVVRVALVDARRARVLWKGDIASDPAPGDSPAVLATLASNLVKTLIPS